MDVDAPTTSEEVVHDDPESPTGATTQEVSESHDDHEHMSDSRYVVIAAILAAITAAEVAASYVDLGSVFIPLLLGMMAIKFFVVVSYFMHLKFDNNIFKRLFYTGLFLAMAVYLAALVSFRFFGN